jgi:lipopolysaccharide transport protein LptA
MRSAAMLLCLLVGAPPQGRLQVEGEPVELSSKGGIAIDLSKNVGIAKDDVVIRRKDVTVCCDEAEASYAGGKIERVTCRGRVVIVRPDGTRASAGLAVYSAGEDTVTLTGRPKVFAKDAHLVGETIVYDIGKDKLEVAGKRSKFSFAPSKKAPELRACPPR